MQTDKAGSGVLRKQSGRRRMPLIWKHMVMMLCILLVAVLVLLINHRQSLRTLTEENLSKLQISLERNCAALDQRMVVTSAIPDGVEGTRYYDYIKTIHSGELDVMYYPVLQYIRRALNNQMYLQGTGEVCVLYLSGCNSIVTNEHVFPVAQDCFSSHLRFTQTGEEVLMGYLRDSSAATLLPMQQVKIGHAHCSPYLTLVLHPRGSPMAVMLLYAQQTILEELGYPYLPEGTILQMTAEDGQILLQTPESAQEHARADDYELSAQMSDFRVQVTIRVPRAYFAGLLRPIRISGLGSILFVTVFGVLLSFFFSKASVTPIHRLIQTHGADAQTESVNEIAHLDSLLSSSRRRSEDLQQLLSQQILARALSGTVLSEHDERFLEQSLDHPSGDYQIAILHTTRQINPILGEHLRAQIPELTCAILNEKETGLFFPAAEPCPSRLIDAIDALNAQKPDAQIHCGISAPAIRLDALHIAARQARSALPQEAGVRSFPGSRIGGQSVSWLQHERLYQSISANDEEETLRLLQIIAGQTDHTNARETFYNVRFVLRSAAEELGVTPEEGRETEYSAELLPRENIRRLADLVRNLFVCVREKNEQNIDDFQQRILDYMQQQMADYDLCAASVAAEFRLPEKKVYEAVRKKTGMTFREYLTSMRMKKAAELLYSTKDSILDIAQACGYRGSSTFYRLFQEYHGVAPGQYRRDEHGAGDSGHSAQSETGKL